MTAAIIAFALGVWWLQQQAVLPTFPLSAIGWWGIALCAVAAVAAVIARSRRIAMLVLAALLGFAWAAGLAHLRLADRLDPALEGRDLVVTGVVAGLPAIGERSVRFDFDIESATLGSGGVGSAGGTGGTGGTGGMGGSGSSVVLPSRVALSWYRSGFSRAADEAPAVLDDAGGIHPGDRWLFTVRLKRPHGSVNPHGFDYEAWLLERRIGATGYVRQRGEQRNIGVRNTLADRIERVREAVRTRFLAVLGDSTSAGVLVALAVGDQRAIDAEDWRLFSRTGVTHLMSISGLHVTLISGLVAALVSYGWRRQPVLALFLPARKAAAAAAALTALCYTLLAGFGVPAQRTFFMLAVVAAALWFGRISSPARILALAMLAVLLLDPWAVLAAGFWLSFGAVGLIFYVSQGWTGHDAVQPANVVKSESQVERELRQRELQPALPESRSVPRWSVAGWLTPWLSQWGRIQWAITVGLAPAVLLLFSQVSLVGPLANALAIPVVSGIITPLALIGAAVPLDAILQLADLLTVWLLGFLAWCDALPLALWQQPAPPPWSVLVALLGVLWLLAPRGVASRWVGLLLFIPALCVVPPRPAHGEAWVITLDVGQGLAVLVLTAEHALLYDTGPTWGSDSDSGERIIAPYLRAVGARNLDAMIVTHNDSDHSGGAVSVMRNAEVGWLASSLSPGNPLARMAADSRRCERGQRWQWDGVEFAFLHPSREDYADASLKNNNLSCVLRIASAHGSMLLTGDVERAAESLLVAREGTDLRAEVLLAPHHGSRTSSTAEFLAAVRPQWVVVPVGYRNRFGHPRADVLARYAEIDARVRRTDFDGALIARLAGGGITVYGEREVRARYWYAARL